MVAHLHAWMTIEFFLNWISHFVASLLGSVSTQNLHLICNGHGRHLSIQSIDEENKIGIDLLTFSAHTTQMLQQINFSVFFSFNIYFRSKRVAWMENNSWV